MCNCFCFFLSLRMLISVDFSIFYLSIYLPPLSTSVCLSWIYLTAVLFVLSSFVLTVPSSKFRVVVPSSRSRPSHPIPSHRSPRYPVSRVRSLSSCQWSMFCSVLFSMIRLARIRNITNAIPPRPHPIPSPFSFPVCQSVEPEVRPNYHRACAHAGDVTTMGARCEQSSLAYASSMCVSPRANNPGNGNGNGNALHSNNVLSGSRPSAEHRVSKRLRCQSDDGGSPTGLRSQIPDTDTGAPPSPPGERQSREETREKRSAVKPGICSAGLRRIDENQNRICVDTCVLDGWVGGWRMQISACGIVVRNVQHLSRERQSKFFSRAHRGGLKF